MHFPERHRAQGRIVAGMAEAILPRITGVLRWTPRSRIHVVVLDSADFSNGVASPVPFNYTMVFLAPPEEGELLQNREWLELVMTHELFHLVHLDKARAAPLGLRNVFGRLSFLFPNALQPRWIVEGLAVHAESDPSRGWGRLGQAQFEGMMRAEASRGFRSLAEINADGRGFPLNRAYLYGAYFFAFLEERYGRKAVADFVEAYSDNLIPWRVHSNPVAVTGKNMDLLWAEYNDWLGKRFGAARPAERQGEVVARNWSLSSPTLSPDGARWYVRSDGYSRPQLVRQAPGGKPEALRDVEGDARIAAAADGSVLLADPDICRNYNYYYDLSRIASNGRRKPLTDCGRFRLAAPLEDGRAVALRVEAGEGQAVLIEADGKVGSVLYRAAPGESLTGVAAKGSSVVLTSLRDGRWSLIGIAGGTASVLLSDAAIKHSPRLGEGGEVFFIANYDKLYNVWSLRRDGQLSRWTEAPSGVREISAPQAGEMLLTTIEPDGDALRSYPLPAQPLEQRQAQAPAPAPPAEAAAAPPPVVGADRTYWPFSSMLPRSWLPLIDLSDGKLAFGVTTYGQDALGVHQYAIAPVIEVTQSELLGSALYVYDGRHGFLVNRDMRVRSTTGPDDDPDIQSYTIEDGAQGLLTWRHLALNRRFYWGLGGALQRERLHLVNGPSLTDQDERVVGLVAGVDTRRTFWLSEGPTSGQQLRLFAETGRDLHGAFPGDVYRADWRLHVGIGKTVASLRWNEAWGEDDAERFELGGSDTDWPTPLPVINQRDFALRGYSNGALVGHRARVVTLELRVPLSDIDRHLMVPPVGLNRLSMNIFVDVGAAWDRGMDPDYHHGVGIELMSEVRIGYNMGGQFRFGIAHGLNDPGETKFYLKLGRSF